MVKPTLVRVAGFVVVAAGVAVAVCGGVVLAQRMQTVNTWPLVEARVVESDAFYPPATNPPEARYQLWYQVGDQTYTERFVSRGDVIAVRDRVAAHPSGSVAGIRYNPVNPREVNPNLGMNAATLGWAVTLLGAGLATILLGAALIVISKRPRRRF